MSTCTFSEDLWEGFSVTVSPLVSQVLWECSWELHPGQGLPASREQASPAGAVWGLQSSHCPCSCTTELVRGAITASHSWEAFLTDSSHTQSRVFLKWHLRSHHGSCCAAAGGRRLLGSDLPCGWGKRKPSATADPWTLIAKLPSITELAKLC